MKNFKIYIVLLLVVAVASCKDFLDVEPQNKFLNVNYYETNNQAWGALIAAYDPLQYSYVDGHWTSTVLLGEIWSDNANAGGANDGDQPGWQAIDDLKNDPSTIETTSFYKKYYIGINKANQLLNNIRIDNDTIRQYIAEAKFLRAYHHFELVRTYGPITVTTTVPAPGDALPGRNTITEVYAQIRKDLLEAIPLLPKRSGYPASMAGRVTQGAAHALLAKAYLYEADILNDDKALFDSAAFHFAAVISSGEYQLLDDYKGLYAFGAANTVESVFEIQYSNIVPSDWNVPTAFMNGNLIVQLVGIRGLCATDPINAPGWGFLLPTASLYNSFLSDDNYRRDASIVTDAQLAAESCPVDPAQQNPSDFTHNWQNKYLNYKLYTAPNGGELNVLKDPNQPVIRYADVLLMYAEAIVRGTSGSTSTALNAIDIVRERAKGPGDNTGNFKTGAQIMTQQGWTIMDLIHYERRSELACEGDRWFDLVRSGRATADLFLTTDLRHGNFSSDDMYLPIPQTEVDQSSGILKAYPDQSLFQ